MERTSNVQPMIEPDPEQMLRHLEHLFGGDLDGCHEGKIELAWADSDDGRLRHADIFGTDQLDELVERAVRENKVPGQNVYVGQALRKPDIPPFGRCKDEDFFALTAFYVDIDDDVVATALRAAYRIAFVQPLGGIFEGILGSIGSAFFGNTQSSSTAPPAGTNVPNFGAGGYGVAHHGGVIGRDALPTRFVDPAVFDHATRYHSGGLVPGEVPIIARQGEVMFTPGQVRALGAELGRRPEVHVTVNVDNRAPGIEARTGWRRNPDGGLALDIVVEQIEGNLARNIGRGEGLAPTMERRYGLNPAAGSYR